MSKIYSFFVFFIFLSYTSVVFCDDTVGNENINCNATSCEEVTCKSLPTNCQIQNATHNGVFLPAVNTCNCCDYCLVNLKKGEDCTVGTPSNTEHTSICGPGLTCIPVKVNETDGTCRRMDSECLNLQADFDIRRKNGSLGSLEVRQTCDDDGFYDSYRCVPGQTCYCQHKNGSRIFGEGDFNNIGSYMPCACSRKYYDMVELLGYELNSVQHFRCDSMGNYDRWVTSWTPYLCKKANVLAAISEQTIRSRMPIHLEEKIPDPTWIQCIGRKCLCTDAIDGAPTFPDQDLVNLTLISNKTLEGCYTSKIPGQFYKNCEEEYVKVLNKSEEQKEKGYDGVTGFRFPKCDLDGTYRPVQENTTHKYCVDKVGTILAIIDKKANADLADKMDCKCLRANLIMSTKEKPVCLQNGNFDPVQCRRGICYCVDSNGNQVCREATKPCEEVDENLKEQLSCYNTEIFGQDKNNVAIEL